MRYLPMLFLVLMIISSCDNSEPKIDPEKEARLEQEKEQEKKEVQEKKELQQKINKYSPIIWKKFEDEEDTWCKYHFELEEKLTKVDAIYLFNSYIKDIEKLNDSIYILHCKIVNSYGFRNLIGILKLNKKLVDKIIETSKCSYYEDYSLFVKVDNLKRVDLRINPEIAIYKDNSETDINLEIAGEYILTGNCIDLVHIRF